MLFIQLKCHCSDIACTLPAPGSFLNCLLCFRDVAHNKQKHLTCRLPLLREGQESRNSLRTHHHDTVLLLCSCGNVLAACRPHARQVCRPNRRLFVRDCVHHQCRFRTATCFNGARCQQCTLQLSGRAAVGAVSSSGGSC